jgi:hypothetical protein
MNFLKQMGPIMSRGNEIPLSVSNPSLANVIEDTILFGRTEEFDLLINLVTDHPQIPVELRYGLEGLKFFRQHYRAENLSPEARAKVSSFDTQWSMSLIDMVRQGSSEIAGMDFDLYEQTA